MIRYKLYFIIPAPISFWIKIIFHIFKFRKVYVAYKHITINQTESDREQEGIILTDESYKQEHFYAEFFHKNFGQIKNKKLDILEIGLAKGAGIASFYFYFPFSNLIGVDNNPFKTRYKSKRIRNMYVDISSRQILKNLTNHLNQKFDLIIEDCSHKLIDQILCFSENFKNLKKGGIYIVEDLNFPEIHKMYNPTNEAVDLKTILKKINLGEEIFTKFMKENEIEYIQNNIENIKFYKGHDNSEIVFIKKKVHGTEKEPS